MPATPASNEKRSNARSSVSLNATVKARDDRESYWKQTTELISLSRSGAGFYLDRECRVGSLILLALPMPKHLRSYDFEKDSYRVWGLVQHCIPAAGGELPAFHVGVAFAGRNAPRSYRENPLQSYRIGGINDDGTWKIVEAKENFVERRHARYRISLEVLLSNWNDDGKLILDEAAQTENLSLSGAAVFSTIDVNVGDSIYFDSIPHGFSTLAVVRNRQTLEDAPPRLHLEFINAAFPLERLNLPSEDLPDDDESDEGFY